jgi:hypothetical protein
VTGECVFKKAVATVVGNPLEVRSPAANLPPDAPANPLAKAAASSATGLATCVGVLPLLHQLFTCKLNLSPAITFKMIAGPIFCKPAAAPPAKARSLLQLL